MKARTLVVGVLGGASAALVGPPAASAELDQLVQFLQGIGSAAMIPEVVAGRGSDWTCRLRVDFVVACGPVATDLLGVAEERPV